MKHVCVCAAVQWCVYSNHTALCLVTIDEVREDVTRTELIYQ